MTLFGIDIWELLGRYVLTGIILWGTVLIASVISFGLRIRKFGYFDFMRAWRNAADEVGKNLNDKDPDEKLTLREKIDGIISMVIYPYGIPLSIYIWYKISNRAIEMLTKESE